MARLKRDRMVCVYEAEGEEQILFAGESNNEVCKFLDISVAECSYLISTGHVKPASKDLPKLYVAAMVFEDDEDFELELA